MLQFFLLFFSIILFSHFSINSFSDERLIVLSCALFRNDRTVPKSRHTDTSSNAVQFMLRLLFLKCFTLFVVVWGLYLRAKLVVYIYIYIFISYAEQLNLWTALKGPLFFYFALSFSQSSFKFKQSYSRKLVNHNHSVNAGCFLSMRFIHCSKYNN